MAGDHYDVPFLQAEKYSKGRPDGPPLWVVVHTMQDDELSDTAENVARYFAYNTGSRSVSSHYTADNDSIVQCVRLRDVAWTVGNRPGNYRGINWELAGYAEQSAAGWADAYSQAMLRRAAPIMARDMARYSIPNRWCTVADLQARRPGLTDHNDLRLAFGGTTHWDPGPNFPRAQLSDLIRAAQGPVFDPIAQPKPSTEEDDMPQADTYHLPSGFAFDEKGKLLDRSKILVLPLPVPGQYNGNVHLPFGPVYVTASTYVYGGGSTRLVVAVHNGAGWAVIDNNVVIPEGGRHPLPLPAPGDQAKGWGYEVVIGRARKTATDTLDNAPTSVLVEIGKA